MKKLTPEQIAQRQVRSKRSALVRKAKVLVEFCGHIEVYAEPDQERKNSISYWVVAPTADVLPEDLEDPFLHDHIAYTPEELLYSVSFYTVFFVLLSHECVAAKVSDWLFSLAQAQVLFLANEVRKDYSKGLTALIEELANTRILQGDQTYRADETLPEDYYAGGQHSDA